MCLYSNRCYLLIFPLFYSHFQGILKRTILIKQIEHCKFRNFFFVDKFDTCYLYLLPLSIYFNCKLNFLVYFSVNIFCSPLHFIHCFWKYRNPIFFRLDHFFTVSLIFLNVLTEQKMQYSTYSQYRTILFLLLSPNKSNAI